MTEKEHRIIPGRYLEDILAQPAALQSTLLETKHVPEELLRIRESLQDGRLKRIVLTGMGSSFYSLMPLHLALIKDGYEAVQVETSELIHYMPGLLQRDSLVIAVSQSGRSAEMIRLLELNARQATLLVITNTPQSPLALAADAVMLTRAGEEFSVSCKTYVCTLAVVELIAGFLSHEQHDTLHDELLEAVPCVTSYLQDWQQHVLELAPYLDGMGHLFFVGRGASLAAAGTGALITKESAGVHAEAMSSAAFRHGPMEILREDTLVAVLEGAPVTRELNQRLLQEVNNSPAKALLIGTHGELTSLRITPSPDRIASILEVLPFEMMTLTLAYLASAEAGVFRRGAKVTVTE